MAHGNTIFSQILKWVPRHEFETLANQYRRGRSFRTASRWSQFVTLAMTQLSGRNSLRDIVENMSAQAPHRLYHLGSAKLTRSNLSRINEDKPYALYEALFSKLLNRDGYLPEFVTVTEGKIADITVGRALAFPKDSLVVIDRAYIDYVWFKQLTEKGIFFVTRIKFNAKYRIICRRAGYRCPETGKHYVFLTNHFKLAAKTIADIYKARWQVELFFKWIKQNLKIKSFIGTSKNPVLTQIWITLCVYLLLAFIKFQSKLTKIMQQILRVLQLNHFEKRELFTLLRGAPLPDKLHAAQ